MRTRLDSETMQMWFILESLPTMPDDALHEASEKLMEGLKIMMPGSELSAAKL